MTFTVFRLVCAGLLRFFLSSIMLLMLPVKGGAHAAIILLFQLLLLQGGRLFLVLYPTILDRLLLIWDSPDVF